tara:strand:- start:1189 stop:1545 length:357 start_codon:yes stop_codon:yes gene_type:complete
MIKIELSNATNGIIKKVIHSTFGSNDSIDEEITIFETLEETSKESIEKVIQLLYSISDDLGLDTGSNYDQYQLMMYLDWGSEYDPTESEIDLRIKDLRKSIKDLKEKKNLISINVDNV